MENSLRKIELEDDEINLERCPIEILQAVLSILMSQQEQADEAKL